MLRTNRGGFTLVELLIAMVLMGIVSAAIYQTLLSNQRVYRAQTQRVELNDNLRSALSVLPGEFRELNSSDPAGSDIIAMGDSAITYKVMRNLYFVCKDATGSEVVVDTATIGLRPLSADLDSVVIFADSNTNTTRDDRWIHADIDKVELSKDCAGGAPGLKLSISAKIEQLDSVLAGSPVRAFEVVEARSYADAGGALWLGARRWSKSTGWSSLQPLFGPLASGGLRFGYYDEFGNVTADRTKVARVAITVIGRTSEAVQLSGGGIGYVVDSMVTQVALRNNR